MVKYLLGAMAWHVRVVQIQVKLDGKTAPVGFKDSVINL